MELGELERIDEVNSVSSCEKLKTSGSRGRRTSVRLENGAPNCDTSSIPIQRPFIGSKNLKARDKQFFPPGKGANHVMLT